MLDQRKPKWRVLEIIGDFSSMEYAMLFIEDMEKKRGERGMFRIEVQHEEEL